MREYKFYRIGKDGHIKGPAVAHVLLNDRSAIRKARLSATGNDIEVWQGTRLVSYVVADAADQAPPGVGRAAGPRP